MPKARRVKLNKDLCRELDIDKEAIYQKVQDIVDRRTGKSVDDIDEMPVWKDFEKYFLKKELVAYLDATLSEAAKLRLFIQRLMEAEIISRDNIDDIIEVTPNPTDEEIEKMFDIKPKDDDEDFT